MRTFAINRDGSAATPTGGQQDPGATSRAHNAQELKVAVPPTQLNHSSWRPTSQQQLQQESYGSDMPPPQPRNGQAEHDPFTEAPIEHDDEAHRSMFGTDTEHFDDSTMSQSHFTEGQARTVTQAEVQGYEESDMEQPQVLEDEHEGVEEHVIHQHPEELHMQAIGQPLARGAGHPIVGVSRQAAPAFAKSYPTTTSGRLDEGDYGGTGTNEDEGELKAGSRKARPQIPLRHQSLQPPHSEWSIRHTGFQREAPNQLSQRMYQQAAIDREQTRSVPNGAKRRTELQPASARPHSAVSAQTQKAAPRAEKAVQSESQTRKPQVAKKAGIQASRQEVVVPLPSPNLSTQHPTGHDEPDDDEDEDEDEDEDDADDELVPVDYNEDELRAMPYSTLANEPFDHAPRTAPPALPLAASQAKLALPSRLTAVQRTADAATQTSFLASLTMDEWDEAGDWFLDRFGGIVQAMREARQRKRSVAREFEDEVAARDAQVARKRLCVEQALLQMRCQGAGLLQATPRKRNSNRGASPTK